MGQFFQILGALGIFLFGMKVMSEGVQKAAGSGAGVNTRAAGRGFLVGRLTA